MSSPKLFISYSWSSPEHEQWVLQLGTELRENGVNAMLDKWDLKEGNDANAFMERMVTDPEIKKVILVIDEHYCAKADRRSGGVGTEAQIISAEVYESVDQSKFVAVIAGKDAEGKTKLPAFYKGRIYIDLSDEDLYAKNFEDLLRWIYDKPLYIKPELGGKPAFLNDADTISLGTAVAARRFMEAARNSRSHARGSFIEYLDIFAKNLENFRLPASNGATDFPDRVLENIGQFMPYRAELIEVMGVVAQFECPSDAGMIVHKFFESLISFLHRPAKVTRYHDWDLDNLKFIIHETVLVTIAIFIKYERFEVIKLLLREKYYCVKDETYGRSKMDNFGVFRSHLQSLEYRNKSKEENRLSPVADLMKERCNEAGLSYEQLMQADFLLYLVSSIEAANGSESRYWWPDTLVFKAFRGGTFEMFLRSESQSYFNNIAPILGVGSKSGLATYIQKIREQGLYLPRWQFDTLNPVDLMNYEKLCSLP